MNIKLTILQNICMIHPNILIKKLLIIVQKGLNLNIT